MWQWILDHHTVNFGSYTLHASLELLCGIMAVTLIMVIRKYYHDMKQWELDND